MKNMMRTKQKNSLRSWRLIIAVLLLVCTGGLLAQAAPAIKQVDYEGKGRVEVSFKKKVFFKGVKVKVRDEAGKAVKAAVGEKDDDEIEWTIPKYKMGQTYHFTISGVKAKGDKEYTSVSGKIWIPVAKGKIPVKETEYDAREKEVEFEFPSAVQWKNVKVTITDGKKEYFVKVLEKERKTLEVKVRKLKKGSIYQYKISGVRKKGTEKYVTVSGSFMAD